jgi:hypothetical protein
MNLPIGWAFGGGGEVLDNYLSSRFQIDFSGLAGGSILGLLCGTLTLVLHGGYLSPALYPPSLCFVNPSIGPSIGGSNPFQNV